MKNILLLLCLCVMSASYGEETISGNRKILSFSKAKKSLRKIYKGSERTFYCNCNYSESQVNYKGCAYHPKNKKKTRAKRIEWEHIVPAHQFGQSFSAWREGDAKCITKKGKKFKGRKCAKKVSMNFRKMESDLYNLVPAIGEVNNVRGNLHVGMLTVGEKSRLDGDCATKITKNIIEPGDDIKGFVARVYKYMDAAYPGHGIISNKNKKLYDAWDKKYPPTPSEIARAKQIEAVQGNRNPFVVHAPSKI